MPLPLGNGAVPTRPPLSVAFARSRRRCGSATLINYTKNRIPFRHTVRIEPLVNTYGQLRMLKAISCDVDMLVPDAPEDSGLFHDALPPLIYT